MERRRLGRLGHQTSVLIYGGAALSEVSQDEADRSVSEALDSGINHFDVAADYGEAEVRLAPWVRDERETIFLATKTGKRDSETAWSEINSSLERLQTTYVDLLQLHAVGNIVELDLVTSGGGALEAAVRAKDQGMVGAIGITGHGCDAPATHLEALQRYPFDTVLTPLNFRLFQDSSYRSQYEALAAETSSQDIGLMLIKAVARRNWVTGARPTHDTWYEPFSDQELISAAVSWALNRTEATGLATPGDTSLLPLMLEAERNRTPIGRAEEILASQPGYSSPFESMPF